MARVIIIDDDQKWLVDLKEIVTNYFDSIVEDYLDFSEADKRITKSPNDFDLLITDIYVDKKKDDFNFNKAKADFGLSITSFLNLINNIPVIIVTAEDDQDIIGLVFKKYKILKIHQKIGFKNSDFIVSVSQVIPLKNKGGKAKNDDEDLIVI